MGYSTGNERRMTMTGLCSTNHKRPVLDGFFSVFNFGQRSEIRRYENMKCADDEVVKAFAEVGEMINAGIGHVEKERAGKTGPSAE
jgi:hypothetical protein